MEKFVELFLNEQTVFLIMSVFTITFVIRRVIETVWPNVQSNRYWKEIALPVAPIANGAGLGVLMKTFVWPEVVQGSPEGQILYGSVCGLLAGFLYNRIRSYLKVRGSEVVAKAVTKAKKG